MERKQKLYQFWLHNLPDVGDAAIRRLLAAFGDAKSVYGASEKQLSQILKKETAEKIKVFSGWWNMEKAYENMRKKKIAFLTVDDKGYPERLRRLDKPPYAIYCMGKLPGEEKPAVAVIGARECSEYGKYVAESFAGRLAEAGVAVVSGMARGIDGIAQQAALERGGKTYAVLGCGVDVCYPSSNRLLYDSILETGGGILSIFPPGTQPMKRMFPERNRIVAGLSDILLVVEARQKSGTWITVDMALEQGKNVYAVPGRLTDRLSDGCNLLIRQGAGIALSPEDILAELKVLENRREIAMPERETEGILSVLDFTPKSVDQILAELRYRGKEAELGTAMEELIRLCLEGKAIQTAGSFMRSMDGIAGDKERGN
ncbi:MAG: DNA-processing protein DprA [Lachnospiraceae bacterium]|nr:DNA-processing protein DprA [Lachnospiraceae bacterium]MDY5870020.1 DNA-processing protein DprA [Lachnospiraceae bacterium]